MISVCAPTLPINHPTEVKIVLRLFARPDHLSSAMTFFQGKRNETFPERFTIVS